jgi:hypothetical protein
VYSPAHADDLGFQLVGKPSPYQIMEGMPVIRPDLSQAFIELPFCANER